MSCRVARNKYLRKVESPRFDMTICPFRFPDLLSARLRPAFRSNWRPCAYCLRSPAPAKIAAKWSEADLPSESH